MFLYRLAVCGFALIVVPTIVFANTISISPEYPIQGEPILITIHGTSTPSRIDVGGKRVGLFVWQGKQSSLYGIDLNKPAGTSTISVLFSDGQKTSKDFFVSLRKKEEVLLGIPVKLGGNSTSSATKLVSTLALENKSLLGLKTGTHAFWREPFRYPLASTTITDSYGYSRQTVGQVISHKGTDFRAKEGTAVLAVNRGVVRLVQTGRNYGKTIIIDHGLGVQSLYMHLSKIFVNTGELVSPGQVIGLSGQTGYAENPHLHLSIRIGEISIDPIRFFNLFK